MSQPKLGYGMSRGFPRSADDKFSPGGRVEIFATRGRPSVTPKGLISGKGAINVYSSCDIDFSSCEILHQEDVKNVIVNSGKDKLINAVATGAVNVICRMAIGDRGTLPSDPSTPKQVNASMTSLYNEVHREDIDLAILDIGTAEKHEVRFVKTFSATDIPLSAFSNSGAPVINEVGLITADLISGSPLPRDPVSSPATPDEDEALFAVRTYKSIPFEAANDISLTVRYTIYVE